MEKSLQEMKKTLVQQMNKKPIKILDLENSLKKLGETKKSIARVGDGELDLILGRSSKLYSKLYTISAGAFCAASSSISSLYCLSNFSTLKNLKVKVMSPLNLVTLPSIVQGIIILLSSNSVITS